MNTPSTPAALERDDELAPVGAARRRSRSASAAAIKEREHSDHSSVHDHLERHAVEAKGVCEPAA